MKINRELLMSKLSKANSIANYKDAKGIVKLTVKKLDDNNRVELSFYGADGINTAITTLEIVAENANVGEYFVDANKVIGYLKNLGAFGAEEVSIIFTDMMEIKTEKTNFEFPLESPKSYPEMPTMNPKEDEEVFFISVDSKMFVNRLSILSKTIITDGTRPILNYANLKITAKEMAMVTTDATRVTYSIIDCSALYMQNKKAIDKEIAVNVNPSVLSRLLTYEDGLQIQLVVTKDYVYALDKSGMITMKSMNEEYPDVTKFFQPVDFSSDVPFASVLTTNCHELNDALKLMKSGIVNEKEKLVQFNLTTDKQSVSTSKSNGVVDAKDKSTKTGKDSGEITLTGDLVGKDIIIKFDNNKLNVLSNGPSKIRLCFNGPEHPVYVYNAEETKDHRFIIMLMPIK